MKTYFEQCIDDNTESNITSNTLLHKILTRALAAFIMIHGLTLITAWISNYINYDVWDEITYRFQNFNGYTVEV